jgi:hypothetical protein
MTVASPAREPSLLFIIIVAIIDIFIVAALAKWAIFAPVFVPLLMKLGVKPEDQRPRRAKIGPWSNVSRQVGKGINDWCSSSVASPDSEQNEHWTIYSRSRKLAACQRCSRASRRSNRWRQCGAFASDSRSAIDAAIDDIDSRKYSGRSSKPPSRWKRQPCPDLSALWMDRILGAGDDRCDSHRADRLRLHI